MFGKKKDEKAVTVGDQDRTLDDITVRDKGSSVSVSALIDRAVDFAGGRASARVAKMRRKHPNDTPAKLISRLEKEYVSRASKQGGAVGAVAAVPALGTAAALGVTGAQVAAYLESSAEFVLAVAEVHGVQPEDTVRRRTLVLAALLGEEGKELVQGAVGLGSLAWARTAIMTKLPTATVRTVNKQLSKRLAEGASRTLLSRMGGRLLPFGIGAVIGWTGTRSMAKDVVEGSAALFGPAPSTFGRTIEA